MISRRLFNGAGVLGLATLAWRPPWSMAAAPASTGPDVTGPLAVLGDAWEGVGRDYDRVSHKVLQYSRQAGGFWRAEPHSPTFHVWSMARKYVEASARVIIEPSRSPGDVILKYHVIDMHSGWRAIDDGLWIEAGGGRHERTVLQEAEAFGVNINAFWLPGSASPFAEIDGERDSPRWSVIDRWRRWDMPVSQAIARYGTEAMAS